MAAEISGLRRAGSLTLPSGVLERLPFLQDERCVFFDFGLMLFAPPASVSSLPMAIENMTREPIVAVITERHLITATFPRATRVPQVIPHDQISGVSKEGDDRITIHVSGASDIRVMLGKSDTFVVYLVDLQDRAMGRAMHFAQQQKGQTQQQNNSQHAPRGKLKSNADGAMEGAGPQSRLALTASALHAAEAALEQTEVELGAVRFGRASQRSTRPPAEIDENSDASSVATIDHAVDDADDNAIAVDFPLVTVDASSLHRRLYYFFLQYDRSKLPHLEAMIAHNRGRETQLLQELQAQYGPEPNKARWECRDQCAHQRRLRDQLTAQLKRAKDELLQLSKEEVLLDTSKRRVESLHNEYVERLRSRYRRQPQGTNVQDADKDVDQLELLCVTRLVPMVNASRRPGGADGDSSSMTTSAGQVECVAYWVAPKVFYPFVHSQASKLQGAALPPLCVVQRCVGGTTVTGSSTFSTDIGASPGGGATVGHKGSPSFLCNWSFLAGWALEFGAHSVAVQQESTNSDGVADVKYVTSHQFWRGALH